MIMTDMKKLLHTFDEADEILNDKIDRTNLSTIVASATASVENKKTVLIRGTGRNIEVLKVGGKTVQNGTPTPTNPVEVKGVGDKVTNLVDMMVALSEGNNTVKNSDSSFTTTETTALFNTLYKFSDKDITIKLSGSVKYTDGSNHRIDILDSSKKQVAELRFDNASSVVATGSYIRFNWSTAGRITFNDVMLTTDIDGDTYVPYGKTKYKIPILTDGNTQNIYLDAPLFDGEIADLVGGKVDKKYGMVVFDGSESWTTGTTQGFTYFGLLKTGTAIANAKNNTVAYSDYQVGVSTNNIAENIYVNSGGYLILLTQKLGTTVDAFKTWLSTHNMTVVYELDSAASESFDGASVPVSAAETELTLNTEVTPTSIEATTFGDYYSKAEIDSKKVVDIINAEFEQGAIDGGTSFYNSTKAIRSVGFIKLNKCDMLRFNGVDNQLSIVIYKYETDSTSSYIRNANTDIILNANKTEVYVAEREYYVKVRIMKGNGRDILVSDSFVDDLLQTFSINLNGMNNYYFKDEIDKLINDLDTRLKALEPASTSLDED